ncbi:uncharacterized protein [Solanum lycopersicum]|uniref:uncharacterized protein n=1 Tax=Solanum lycopersicum TaxID=4081 RepID=UPI003749E808
METLKQYEDTFVKLINGNKSRFMLHSNAFNRTRDRIKRLTYFNQKQGPINYLGCPLFVGKPRNIYFSDLVNKVVCKITGWQTKQLRYGGKEKLIKHVLQALPIYLLSAVTPPTTILRKHVEQHIHWKLEAGNSSFRWDNWLGSGPLA